MVEAQVKALDEFVTYDGKCAVCRHLLRSGRFCPLKVRVMSLIDSCESFEMRRS